MVFLIKNFYNPVPEQHRKEIISRKLFWLKHTHQAQQQLLYYSLLGQTDTRHHLIQAPVSGLKTVYFQHWGCECKSEVGLRKTLRPRLKIHFLDCDLIEPPW